MYKNIERNLCNMWYSRQLSFLGGFATLQIPRQFDILVLYGGGKITPLQKVLEYEIMEL